MPVSNNYKIITEGKIAHGTDLAKVQERLEKLFRVESGKLSHLFKGDVTVIKKGLLYEKALKYQEAVKKTGLICRIEDESSVSSPNHLSYERIVKDQSSVESIRSEEGGEAVHSKCPKCGYFFPESLSGMDGCPKCGILLNKYVSDPINIDKPSISKSKDQQDVSSKAPKPFSQISVTKIYSMGWALAVIMSYSLHNSVIWAFFHGALSWLYVLYVLKFYGLSSLLSS